MAKKQIDAAVSEAKHDFTVTTSATVTNAIRVAWDDTTTRGDLIATLERIKQRIIEDIAD